MPAHFLRPKYALNIACEGVPAKSHSLDRRMAWLVPWRLLALAPAIVDSHPQRTRRDFQHGVHPPGRPRGGAAARRQFRRKPDTICANSTVDVSWEAEDNPQGTTSQDIQVEALKVISSTGGSLRLKRSGKLDMVLISGASPQPVADWPTLEGMVVRIRSSVPSPGQACYPY